MILNSVSIADVTMAMWIHQVHFDRFVPLQVMINELVRLRPDDGPFNAPYLQSHFVRQLHEILPWFESTDFNPGFWINLDYAIKVILVMRSFAAQPFPELVVIAQNIPFHDFK